MEELIEDEKKSKVKCGTYSGWIKHKRDKSKACDSCRIAYNAYQSKYRRDQAKLLRKLKSLIKELS